MSEQPDTDDHATQVSQADLVDSPMDIEDVRAIVQLLGDIASMSEPLRARRRELMDRLTAMVNGSAWIWTTSAGFGTGETPMTIGYDYGGFSDREIGMVIEASQDSDYPMPENPPMSADLSAGKHITRTRSDWVSDEELYNHPQWELYRKPMGSDHYVWSLFPVGRSYVSGIGVHRRPGMPDFSARERRIVHVIVSQIPWLHRTDLPDEDKSTPHDLTPRLRVVFALMLQGWNRKQIASHLGISPTTTAGYQKQIYRHFDVGSQPALLARFIQGDGGDVV